MADIILSWVSLLLIIGEKKVNDKNQTNSGGFYKEARPRAVLESDAGQLISCQCNRFRVKAFRHP